MMFCKNCGSMIPAEEERCPECGSLRTETEYCGGFWGLLGKQADCDKAETIRDSSESLRIAKSLDISAEDQGTNKLIRGTEFSSGKVKTANWKKLSLAFGLVTLSLLGVVLVGGFNRYKMIAQFDAERKNNQVLNQALQENNDRLVKNFQVEKEQNEQMRKEIESLEQQIESLEHQLKENDQTEREDIAGTKEEATTKEELVKPENGGPLLSEDIQQKEKTIEPKLLTGDKERRWDDAYSAERRIFEQWTK